MNTTHTPGAEPSPRRVCRVFRFHRELYACLAAESARLGIPLSRCAGIILDEAIAREQAVTLLEPNLCRYEFDPFTEAFRLRFSHTERNASKQVRIYISEPHDRYAETLAQILGVPCRFLWSDLLVKHFHTQGTLL